MINSLVGMLSGPGLSPDIRAGQQAKTVPTRLRSGCEATCLHLRSDALDSCWDEYSNPSAARCHASRDPRQHCKRCNAVPFPSSLRWRQGGQMLEWAVLAAKSRMQTSTWALIRAAQASVRGQRAKELAALPEAWMAATQRTGSC